MKLCNYCGNEAEKVYGNTIYPHLPHLHWKQFFQCKPCDAMVGCHADGRPLGRLANPELRAAKMKAHRLFDPIWQSGKKSRNGAYAWLSEKTGIPKDQCHIGMMDIDQCAKVVAACEANQSKSHGEERETGA